MSVQRFSRALLRFRNAAAPAASAPAPSPSSCAARVNFIKKANSVGSHIIMMSPALSPSHSRISRCRSGSSASISTTPQSKNPASTR